MINFNAQLFRIQTISVINNCIRSYCLSSEPYIATVLETQDRSHVDMYSLYRGIFYVCLSGLRSL